MPSYFISCEQSDKSTSETANAITTFDEKQLQLFNDYIQRLKDYPQFSNNSTSDSPLNWKYDHAAPEVDALIKTQYLNKIANDSSEIDKFINLMEWIHDITQSDGELGNPDTLNSVAIINYVKAQNHAVNCRMKSIVLNEILLAQGYYSRRISFKPSQFDGDSHSIVTVYINEMQKWICLDPTFNTYFYDNVGHLLSFIEIRDTYAKGKIPNFRSINMPQKAPLKLAGIEFSSYNQWYSVYMAKNCFRVSCPQISKFSYENSQKLIYINLLPVGYLDDQSNVNSISTTNRYEFFQKPF